MVVMMWQGHDGGDMAGEGHTKLLAIDENGSKRRDQQDRMGHLPGAAAAAAAAADILNTNIHIAVQTGYRPFGMSGLLLLQLLYIQAARMTTSP